MRTRLEEWRQRTRVLGAQIHAVDPHYVPPVAEIDNKQIGLASYADIAAGRSRSSSRHTSPYRKTKDNVPALAQNISQTGARTSVPSSSPISTNEDVAEIDVKEERPQRKAQTQMKAQPQRETQQKEKDIAQVEKQQGKEKSEVGSRRGRSPTRKMAMKQPTSIPGSTKEEVPSVQIEVSGSKISEMPMHRDDSEGITDSSIQRSLVPREDRRRRTPSPMWLPGSTSYADILRGQSSRASSEPDERVDEMVHLKIKGIAARGVSPVKVQDSPNLNKDILMTDKSGTSISETSTEDILRQSVHSLAADKINTVMEVASWADQPLEDYTTPSEPVISTPQHEMYDYMQPIPQLMGFMNTQLNPYKDSYAYTSALRQPVEQLDQDNLRSYETQVSYTDKHFIQQQGYFPTPLYQETHALHRTNSATNAIKSESVLLLQSQPSCKIQSADSVSEHTVNTPSINTEANTALVAHQETENVARMITEHVLTSESRNIEKSHPQQFEVPLVTEAKSPMPPPVESRGSSFSYAQILSQGLAPQECSPASSNQELDKIQESSESSNLSLKTSTHSATKQNSSTRDKQPDDTKTKSENWDIIKKKDTKKKHTIAEIQPKEDENKKDKKIKEENRLDTRKAKKVSMAKQSEGDVSLTSQKLISDAHRIPEVEKTKDKKEKEEQVTSPPICTANMPKVSIEKKKKQKKKKHDKSSEDEIDRALKEIEDMDKQKTKVSKDKPIKELHKLKSHVDSETQQKQEGESKRKEEIITESVGEESKIDKHSEITQINITTKKNVDEICSKEQKLNDAKSKKKSKQLAKQNTSPLAEIKISEATDSQLSSCQTIDNKDKLSHAESDKSTPNTQVKEKTNISCNEMNKDKEAECSKKQEIKHRNERRKCEKNVLNQTSDPLTTTENSTTLSERLVLESDNTKREIETKNEKIVKVVEKSDEAFGQKISELGLQTNENNTCINVDSNKAPASLLEQVNNKSKHTPVVTQQSQFKASSSDPPECTLVTDRSELEKQCVYELTETSSDLMAAKKSTAKELSTKRKQKNKNKEIIKHGNDKVEDASVIDQINTIETPPKKIEAEKSQHLQNPRILSLENLLQSEEAPIFGSIQDRKKILTSEAQSKVDRESPGEVTIDTHKDVIRQEPRANDKKNAECKIETSDGPHINETIKPYQTDYHTHAQAENELYSFYKIEKVVQENKPVKSPDEIKRPLSIERIVQESKMKKPEEAEKTESDSISHSTRSSSSVTETTSTSIVEELNQRELGKGTDNQAQEKKENSDATKRKVAITQSERTFSTVNPVICLKSDDSWMDLLDEPITIDDDFDEPNIKLTDEKTTHDATSKPFSTESSAEATSKPKDNKIVEPKNDQPTELEKYDTNNKTLSKDINNVFGEKSNTKQSVGEKHSVISKSNKKKEKKKIKSSAPSETEMKNSQSRMEDIGIHKDSASIESSIEATKGDSLLSTDSKPTKTSKLDEQLIKEDFSESTENQAANSQSESQIESQDTTKPSTDEEKNKISIRPEGEESEENEEIELKLEYIEELKDETFLVGKTPGPLQLNEVKDMKVLDVSKGAIGKEPRYLQGREKLTYAFQEYFIKNHPWNVDLTPEEQEEFDYIMENETLLLDLPNIEKRPWFIEAKNNAEKRVKEEYEDFKKRLEEMFEEDDRKNPEVAKKLEELELQKATQESKPNWKPVPSTKSEESSEQDGDKTNTKKPLMSQTKKEEHDENVAEVISDQQVSIKEKVVTGAPQVSSSKQICEEREPKKHSQSKETSKLLPCSTKNEKVTSAKIPTKALTGPLRPNISEADIEQNKHNQGNMKEQSNQSKDNCKNNENLKESGPKVLIVKESKETILEKPNIIKKDQLEESLLTLISEEKQPECETNEKRPEYQTISKNKKSKKPRMLEPCKQEVSIKAIETESRDGNIDTTEVEKSVINKFSEQPIEPVVHQPKKGQPLPQICVKKGPELDENVLVDDQGSIDSISNNTSRERRSRSRSRSLRRSEIHEEEERFNAVDPKINEENSTQPSVDTKDQGIRANDPAKITVTTESQEKPTDAADGADNTVQNQTCEVIDIKTDTSCSSNSSVVCGNSKNKKKQKYKKSKPATELQSTKETIGGALPDKTVEDKNKALGREDLLNAGEASPTEKNTSKKSSDDLKSVKEDESISVTNKSNIKNKSETDHSVQLSADLDEIQKDSQLNTCNRDVAEKTDKTKKNKSQDISKKTKPSNQQGSKFNEEKILSREPDQPNVEEIIISTKSLENTLNDKKVTQSAETCEVEKLKESSEQTQAIISPSTVQPTKEINNKKKTKKDKRTKEANSMTTGPDLSKEKNKNSDTEPKNLSIDNPIEQLSLKHENKDVEELNPHRTPSTSVEQSINLNKEKNREELNIARAVVSSKEDNEKPQKHHEIVLASDIPETDTVSKCDKKSSKKNKKSIKPYQVNIKQEQVNSDNVLPKILDRIQEESENKSSVLLTKENQDAVCKNEDSINEHLSTRNKNKTDDATGITGGQTLQVDSEAICTNMDSETENKHTKGQKKNTNIRQLAVATPSSKLNNKSLNAKQNKTGDVRIGELIEIKEETETQKAIMPVDESSIVHGTPTQISRKIQIQSISDNSKCNNNQKNNSTPDDHLVSEAAPSKNGPHDSSKSKVQFCLDDDIVVSPDNRSEQNIIETEANIVLQGEGSGPLVSWIDFISKDSGFWVNKHAYQEAEREYFEALALNLKNKKKSKNTDSTKKQPDSKDDSDNGSSGKGGDSNNSFSSHSANSNNGTPHTERLVADLPGGIGSWSDDSTYLSLEKNILIHDEQTVNSENDKLTKSIDFDPNSFELFSYPSKSCPNPNIHLGKKSSSSIEMQSIPGKMETLNKVLKTQEHNTLTAKVRVI